jgi:hypothetical protein
LVALETHGSGGGDSGSAFSTEATFLSNNHLVLAVTPSTESQVAVSRASLSQTSGTAESDSADDPYSYWLRLLGDELFQQWLQLSQAPTTVPVDQVAFQTAVTDESEPVSQERAALTSVFEESESYADTGALVPAHDIASLATLTPAADSTDSFSPHLAMAAAVAGLGFAEMRSVRHRQVVSHGSRSRPGRRSRALGFTELPDRT